MFNHHLHRMSRIAYELHATVAEWTCKSTGRKCKRTVQIGTVFQSDNGALSARIEVVPVLPGWSGFVAFRPVLPPDRHQPRGMPPPPPPANPNEPDPDADVPF
jgi:hypothetical protein